MLIVMAMRFLLIKSTQISLRKENAAKKFIQHVILAVSDLQMKWHSSDKVITYFQPNG